MSDPIDEAREKEVKGDKKYTWLPLLVFGSLALLALFALEKQTQIVTKIVDRFETGTGVDIPFFNLPKDPEETVIILGPVAPSEPPVVTSPPTSNPPGTTTPTVSPTVTNPPVVTIPPVVVPPITIPPVTLPPIPPVVIPPVSLPPVSVPPISLPIVETPSISIPLPETGEVIIDLTPIIDTVDEVVDEVEETTCGLLQILCQP